MRSLAACLALAGLLLLPQAAGARATSVFFPVEDVGLPFWCDWSYDWEARCYRDEGARLPVGGVDDKVWRSALRLHVSAAVPQWLRFDVTELVRAWRDGSVPNHGVLLKLAEEQEAYDSGGPYAPSSSFSDPGARPRLVVTHSTP